MTERKKQLPTFSSEAAASPSEVLIMNYHSLFLSQSNLFITLPLKKNMFEDSNFQLSGFKEGRQNK